MLKVHGSNLTIMVHKLLAPKYEKPSNVNDPLQLGMKKLTCMVQVWCWPHQHISVRN